MSRTAKVLGSPEWDRDADTGESWREGSGDPLRAATGIAIGCALGACAWAALLILI